MKKMVDIRFYLEHHKEIGYYMTFVCRNAIEEYLKEPQNKWLLRLKAENIEDISRLISEIVSELLAQGVTLTIKK